MAGGKDSMNEVELVRRLKKELGTGEDNMVATVENILEERSRLEEEIEKLS